MTSPALTSTRTIYNPVQEDWATFLELSAETGRTLMEVEVAPGGGNAPHVHLTYAETFEVLEGALTVRLGRTAHTVGVGERVVAPARAVHCFRNETDAPVRFLCELRPGHRGMEEALQVAYGLGLDGGLRRDGTPKNLLVGALLAEWADIRAMGTLRLVQPILAPLAAMARRRGLDVELRERYVRH